MKLSNLMSILAVFISASAYADCTNFAGVYKVKGSDYTYTITQTECTKVQLRGTRPGGANPGAFQDWDSGSPLPTRWDSSDGKYSTFVFNYFEDTQLRTIETSYLKPDLGNSIAADITVYLKDASGNIVSTTTHYGPLKEVKGSDAPVVLELQTSI
jgi:hypothetical protein